MSGESRQPRTSGETRVGHRRRDMSRRKSLPAGLLDAMKEDFWRTSQDSAVVGGCKGPYEKKETGTGKTISWEKMTGL